MRRTILVAGLVAAVAAPSFASARTVCQQRAHERKVVGTVLGAGVGALVGNAISHDTGGTLIGGVGGAVVGNQLARRKCYSYRTSSRTRSYRSAPRGYYDNASYRGGAPRCGYETRPYYNERGELIYAPTQVCR
jgi:uncharacterized protein YcfJ